MTQRTMYRASMLFAVPYMALMAASVLYPYFRIVSLPWFVMQGAYVLIIGMAFVWVFVTGNFGRVKRALAFLGLFGGLYLMMLAQSMATWTILQDSISQILRGTSTLAYQILGIMAVAAAYVLFGKKSIVYTFWGMVAGNILLLFSAMIKIGVGDFISQLLAFYMSLGGEDTPASMAMEVHDLTFAFGTYVIYFAFFDRETPHRPLYILLSCGFFLLGWKRIAIPGILLAGVYIHFMRRQTPARAIRWIGRVGLGLVAFGFAYLIILRSGLYALACRTLGIDTMGRIQLLSFIEKYYQISPVYAGYGIGFISRMMQDYIESGRAVLNAALSIHNDILARFIELGFVGFLLWELYLCYGTSRFIAKRWSVNAAILYSAVLIFCFMTYLTDNTAGYYHINFCLRLFPVAVAADESSARNKM